MSSRGKRVLLWIAIILVAAAGGGGLWWHWAPPAATARDVAHLQGKWVTNSKYQEVDEPVSLVFEGNTFVELRNDEEVARGQFRLRPEEHFPSDERDEPSAGVSPAQIDISYSSGKRQGRTLQGIYNVSIELLQIILAEPGHERPSQWAISSEKGSGYIVWYQQRGGMLTTEAQGVVEVSKVQNGLLVVVDCRKLRNPMGRLKTPKGETDFGHEVQFVYARGEVGESASLLPGFRRGAIQLPPAGSVPEGSTWYIGGLGLLPLTSVRGEDYGINGMAYEIAVENAGSFGFDGLRGCVLLNDSNWREPGKLQWVFPKTVNFRNGPSCKFGPKGKAILRIGPRGRPGGWNEIDIALDFPS